MPDYEIGELVDLAQLRVVFERFTEATGFTIGFLDHPGKNVLIATGWRDICTKYHRACPAAIANCQKSNAHLLDSLSEPGQTVIEECGNGLIDCATPIIVNGKHVASLATGQLLLQEPDIGQFKKQAREFGIDEREYLAALKEIPVFEPDKVREATAFLGEIARIVSELGHTNLQSKERAAHLEREIRERQRAEQALYHSERNYREIFNATSDALFIHNEAGQIIDVNERMCAMFACDRATALTLSLNDLCLGMPPYSVAEGLEKVRLAITDGQQVFEWRSRRRTGELFWSEVALHACEIAGQKRVIASVRDISERKELEAEFLQSQKMEAVGKLAGGVAHDFNNLLNVINGFTDLALRKLDATAPARDCIQEVRTAGERGAVLTRQLLAFSRKQLREPKVLELDGVVQGLVPMLRRLVPENIELYVMAGVGTSCVKVDPGQIEQVIVNLVINACDAMPNGGKLTVSTNPASAMITGALAGSYLLLAIRDTGSGMTDEVKAHLFEPFYTTKPVGKGSGLGLATCYGIVRQNDGYITADSALGRGTIFRIYLPLIEGQPEEVKPVPVAEKHQHATETILVVEDEPALLELVRLGLSELGYTVLSAGDAETAIQLARQNARQLRLVVSDVILPKMSGKELAVILKQEQPQLKILFVSGYTADVISHHGVLDPDVAFLPKPFTITALGAKVRDVLASR